MKSLFSPSFDHDYPLLPEDNNWTDEQVAAFYEGVVEGFRIVEERFRDALADVEGSEPAA